MLKRGIVFGIGVACVLASRGFAQSVDEIIEKHIEAIGGKAAIEGIETIQASGTTQMRGNDAPFKLYWKKPDKYRREMEMMGQEMIFGYDGENTWRYPEREGGRGGGPGGRGSRGGGRFGGGGLRDILGPLYDYEERGLKVKKEGKESMEGTDAFKLKVTDEDGNVRYVFVDAEFFVILKITTVREFQGESMEIDTYYSDYKDVGGIMVAHATERKSMGGPGGRGGGSTQTVYEKIEFNVQLDDGFFIKPEG